MAKRGSIFISSDYSLHPSLLDIGAELQGAGYDITFAPKHDAKGRMEFAKADWPRFFQNADIIVTTSRAHLPRELLQSASRLRGIVFPTIGTEAVEVAVANDLGLIIGHGPTPENFNSMSEATILLILTLLYDLHGTERILRENLPRPDNKRAVMMMGKTLGMVGFGRIARGIVERLSGWGIRILAFDPHIRPEAVPAGIDLVSIDQLLAGSDIVSLHATLTPETHHLIGSEQLALMKPKAYLINTARGGLIDEDALYDALAHKRIAGAALDTFEQEPLAPESPLRALSNIILTPHMIGHTQDIFKAMPRAALENIERVMNGDLPLYCRNPEAGAAWRRRLAALAA